MSDQQDPAGRRDPASDGVILTEGERRRQRRRSFAIAFMLAGLVVLFYLVTIVRMGGNVANRPM